MSQIILQEVESSQIHAIGHSTETNTLAVRFKSKGVPTSLYHYSNFSAEDFAAFKGAESIGKYFGQHIKSAAKHPFVRVDTAPATVAPLQPKPRVAITLGEYEMGLIADYAKLSAARSAILARLNAGNPLSDVDDATIKDAELITLRLAHSIYINAREQCLITREVA